MIHHLQRALLFTLALTFTPQLHAVEVSVDLRLAAHYANPNEDGLFHFQDSSAYSLQELSLGYARDGFKLQATAWHQLGEAGERSAKVLLNELYLDRPLGPWELTLGKKRLSWGVGYGWRPLDVISPEPRRALIAPSVEGLPLIALERYSGEHALTLLCGNRDGRADDSRCALRYFGLVGEWDLQFMAYATTREKLQAGLGFARVFGQGLEVHGEAVYQRRYFKWINRLSGGDQALALDDPMEERRFEHGLKALLGLTYTGSGGHSLLLEYWHDPAGYSRREWRRLRRLSQTQRALLGSGAAPDWAIGLNLLASSRALGATNLLQDNLLLRWSFDGRHHDPAVDLLYTPADGGAVVTASMDSRLSDAVTLNYGLRYFGGHDQALVRALPDRFQAFVVLRAAFNW